MKYIHLGIGYVIFSSFENYSHSGMYGLIRCLHNGKEELNVHHAGFLTFPQSVDEVREFEKETCVHGKSVSLKCKEAEPFPLGCVHIVSHPSFRFDIYTNRRSFFQEMEGVQFHPSVWKLSKEDESGTCPFYYPGREGYEIRTRMLTDH